MADVRKPKGRGGGGRSGGGSSGGGRSGGGGSGGRRAGPVVRRGTLRIPFEVARRIRAGHPWVYREALERRGPAGKPGEPIELVDPDGDFVGRGIADGTTAIAVRVMTRDRRDAVDGALIESNIASAIALRKRLLDWERFECIRLVNADSDGVPAIVVERYGQRLLVQSYSEAMERHLDSIYKALLELDPASIYLQRRYKPLSGDAPPKGAELVAGSAAPVELEIREGEQTFFCDITAPVSTGLFPDLRLGREAIARWAKGRRVLNLFSYTGAISVYAAAGGASEVVAVDVAAKAHARSRRNFTRNGFDGDSYEHIAGDAFKVLAKMADRKRQFDLIVIDPPAFASGSRGGKPWSAQKQYGELVEASLGVLAPGGLLAAASSTHKLSLADYESALARGAHRAKTRLRIVERCFLPPDFVIAPGFPEAHYLKFTISTRD